jgi:hypothetical protein
MTSAMDETASACYYAHTPQGQGSNGYVDVQVDVAEAGSYWIWGRIWGLDWSGDSVFVSVDGEPEAAWHFGSRGSWQWERVTANYVGKKWNLSAGLHTIRFKTREDGARLDVIELSSDPAYVPASVQPCGSAFSASLHAQQASGMHMASSRDAWHSAPALYLAMLVKL